METLILVSESRNYLVCKSLDGTRTVLVAKLHDLCRSPFDGKEIDGVTYEYTNDGERIVTDKSGKRTEQVYPAYCPGDEILAKNVGKRGTGVVVDGKKIEWVDRNVDARRWHDKRTKPL